MATSRSSARLIRTFRRNLRKLREASGLSQSALARKLRVSSGYVCDLERGRRNPNLATLGPIASALGVQVSELVREEKSAKA